MPQSPPGARVVVLGCHFSLGAMKPMGRFFGFGGAINSRMAVMTPAMH